MIRWQKVEAGHYIAHQGLKVLGRAVAFWPPRRKGWHWYPKPSRLGDPGEDFLTFKALKQVVEGRL